MTSDLIRRMPVPPDLIRRQMATQRTLDRYRAKRFDWRRGITCVHFARFHLKAMGHKVPTVPRIRSALGARRALAAQGWASVTDMLDSVLPRRPAPAFMALGDLAVVPGEDGFDSILICAGPQKVMGWHAETGEFVLYDGGMDSLAASWKA